MRKPVLTHEQFVRMFHDFVSRGLYHAREGTALRQAMRAVLVDGMSVREAGAWYGVSSLGHFKQRLRTFAQASQFILPPGTEELDPYRPAHPIRYEPLSFEEFWECLQSYQKHPHTRTPLDKRQKHTLGLVACKEHSITEAAQTTGFRAAQVWKTFNRFCKRTGLSLPYKEGYEPEAFWASHYTVRRALSLDNFHACLKAYSEHKTVQKHPSQRLEPCQVENLWRLLGEQWTFAEASQASDPRQSPSAMWKLFKTFRGRVNLEAAPLNTQTQNTP